jgi:hypothetical protein
MLERSTALTAAGALVMALALFTGQDAKSAQFPMTGTWLMQRGQVGIPLNFSNPMTSGRNNLLNFPNGPIPGMGLVSQTGGSPAMQPSITVMSGVFGGTFSAVVPLGGTTLIQITTHFTATGQSGMLSSSAGPGTLTFCPGSGVCPTSGPPQATGGGRNGRVLYRAKPGGNQFGGVMQMQLQGGGLLKIPRAGFGFANATFQASNAMFGGVGNQHPGGNISTMDLDLLSALPFTQPPIRPTPAGLIPTLGPAPTAGGAFTSCLGAATTPANLGTNLTSCVVGAGGALFGGPQTNSNTGFPWTTGTIYAQQSTNTTAGKDYFTRAGTDGRSSQGLGTITLVAGGITLRNTPSANTSYASLDTLTMVFTAPKTPSSSPAGLAAGAVLMVLAVGYALRKRF